MYKANKFIEKSFNLFFFSFLHLDGRRSNGGQVVQVGAMRFRPNLVASGGEPYAEDGWSNLNIGGKYFTVSSRSYKIKILKHEVTTFFPIIVEEYCSFR